jgi:hypothetical protein
VSSSRTGIPQPRPPLAVELRRCRFVEQAPRAAASAFPLAEDHAGALLARRSHDDDAGSAPRLSRMEAQKPSSYPFFPYCRSHRQEGTVRVARWRLLRRSRRPCRRGKVLAAYLLGDADLAAAKISPIQENIFNCRKFVRPRNTTSTIYVCSNAAYCVRCRGIDCSQPSLHPSPACRPLKGRFHPQRVSVRWTTVPHDARRICGTKDGGRRDSRSASRHRCHRHATASSGKVSSCSRH